MVTTRPTGQAEQAIRMIEVDGVMVQRRLVTELAHQLIHLDEPETASRLLNGLAHEPRIHLSDEDREALCRIFPEPPLELEALWNVICPDDSRLAASRFPNLQGGQLSGHAPRRG